MNKRAISSEMVLTLGFVILTVMVLFIGVGVVEPLMKTEPHYIAFTAAKMIDTAIASPEDVVLTYEFAETAKGSLVGVGFIGKQRDIHLKIEDGEVCMYKDPSLIPIDDGCWKFVKDRLLNYDVKKDEFHGKLTIEKRGGKLIFR